MDKRSERYYERFLNAADGYLRDTQLEEAERNFANALRQVYDRENKLFETAMALRGLGFVYKERASINKSGEETVKATGLFMSSLDRLKEYSDTGQNSKSNVATAQHQINQLQAEIENLHEMFIKEILGLKPDGEVYSDYERLKHYKEILQQTRETCRLKVSALDKLPHLDPGKMNMNADKERAGMIHQMYEEITKSMAELVTCMIDDCIKVMGSPPCRYSVLGLGSTARQEATPYSDLEFCILVENNAEDVLEYFTNLTHFLHLKVVELGETILPSLGIQSLNNYYSENGEDDWFFDKGCRGFSFDGAMPWASKVPTGRDKTNRKPWVQSLIKTPHDMASLLTEKSISKEGYRLADVLSTCILMCGDQTLFQDYIRCTKKAQSQPLLNEDDTSKISDVHTGGLQDSNTETTPWKQRILQELIEVEKRYHTSLSNYIRQPGGSYAVKKDFYRFPSLVLEYLGKYYDTETPSSWGTIDKLEEGKHLSPEAAHNLRTALGIALELRLRAYLDNKSQREYFSGLLNLVARHDAPDNLAMLLLRFFSTVVPLEESVRKIREVGNLSHLKNLKFYDDNPLSKAQMYCQFRQFYKAKEILKNLFVQKFRSSPNHDTDKDLAIICKILGNTESFLENWSEALKYHRIALSINENTYKVNPTPSNLKAIGDSCINYGVALCALKQRKEASDFLQKALEIRNSLLNQSLTRLETVTCLQDVIDALLNLSRCYTSTVEIAKFFNLNGQALKLCEILQQKYNVVYYYYHSLYFHQGLAYYDLRMFQESSGAYYKALALFYRYKTYDLHTDSEAGLLNNLANAVLELGYYDKARTLHYRAYEIRRRIHGDRDHNSLARSLNNFGLVNEKARNFKEAHDFYIQARDMSERIHGADSSYEHLQMYRRNIIRVAQILRSTGFQHEGVNNDN